MNAMEARRWLAQGRADLASARDSLSAGHFEWACFQAQQSGEKALKAYQYRQGIRAIVTHSLRDLQRLCEQYEAGFAGVAEDCRLLDMFYIPTRYPNGLPGNNIPADFYTRGDAEQCIRSAESILQIVTGCLPDLQIS